MKKVDIDEDYKIDEFLKCEDAVVSSNLDPQKLAGEILKTKTPKTFSFKLIRFGLPLASCMAVFLGLVIHRSDQTSRKVPGVMSLKFLLLPLQMQIFYPKKLQ